MIRVKIYQQHKDLPLPEYKTPGAAAMDLYAAEDFYCYVNDIVTVPTGLYVEIPTGWEIIICSRSGLASKGFWVVNQPGTIDSDYRGEIKVLMLNIGSSVTSGSFLRGSRIAQMKLQPVYRLGWHAVESLD